MNHKRAIRRRDKIALTAALGGLTLGLFGMGASASFTATTSADQTISSGTVILALGAADSAANRLTIEASNIAPGDTIERAVDLTNSGTLDMSTIALTTSAATSSLLDTDATNGLQMTVQSCSIPWTESGTSPAFTYACDGALTTLVDSEPVIGSDRGLDGLAALDAGETSHMMVELVFPESADNTFQDQTSVISYSFDGVQRAPESR